MSTTGRPLAVLLLLALAPACTDSRTLQVRRSLAALDAAIDHRAEYDARMEQAIDSVRVLYDAASGYGKCLLSEKMLDLYKDHKFDSASAYAVRRCSLYLTYGSEREAVASDLDRMLVQGRRGLDVNVLKFSSLDTSRVRKLGLWRQYLSTGVFLYRTAKNNITSPDDKDAYRAAYRHFKQEYERLYPGNRRHTMIRLMDCRDNADFEGIIELAGAVEPGDCHISEQPTIDYYLAQGYEHCGQEDVALELYAKSALTDIVESKNRTNSLAKLAYLLARRGDETRALRYLHVATDISNTNNYQHRLPEIADTLSKISDTAMHSEREKSVIVTSALLFCLAALALVFILLVRKGMLNRRLTRVNRMLDDMNVLKDNYLMRYMVKCTGYIRLTDARMSELKAVLRKDGADALAAELRKPNFSDSEFKHFYEEFDSTFLRICPSFLDVVNSASEGRAVWSLGRGGALPMELRVLAVMRIGILDNADIASFLNFPLPSVYTYKYKLRKALDLKDNSSLQEFVSSLAI